MLVDQFRSDVAGISWRALAALHDLLGPLDQAIHHVETSEAPLSWVYVHASTLVIRVQTWNSISPKSSTTRYFDRYAFDATGAAGWLGSGLQ